MARPETVLQRVVNACMATGRRLELVQARVRQPISIFGAPPAGASRRMATTAFFKQNLGKSWLAQVVTRVGRYQKLP